MIIKSICVYCGSSKGASPEYLDAAVELGQMLADKGIKLIYGGASVGVMGKLADTVLKHGGTVTGIIPEHLSRKVAHSGLTEIRIVDSMHTRKAMMIEMSNAMIALPGGLGTFEEILEAAAWRQLGLHAKPCGLLNIKGYYNGLLEFLDNAVKEHFVKPQHRAIFQVADNPETLLKMLENFKLGNVEKWLD